MKTVEWLCHLTAMSVEFLQAGIFRGSNCQALLYMKDMKSDVSFCMLYFVVVEAIESYSSNQNIFISYSHAWSNDS